MKSLSVYCTEAIDENAKTQKESVAGAEKIEKALTSWLSSVKSEEGHEVGKSTNGDTEITFAKKENGTVVAETRIVLSAREFKPAPNKLDCNYVIPVKALMTSRPYCDAHYLDGGLDGFYKKFKGLFGDDGPKYLVCIKNIYGYTKDEKNRTMNFEWSPNIFDASVSSSTIYYSPDKDILYSKDNKEIDFSKVNHRKYDKSDIEQYFNSVVEFLQALNKNTKYKKVIDTYLESL